METGKFRLSRVSVPMLTILLFSFRAYTAMGVNFFIPIYNSHERLFYIFSTMFLFLYLLMAGRKIYLDGITWLCLLLIMIPLIWNNYDLKNGEIHKLYSLLTVLLFFLLFRTNENKNWKQAFAYISIGTAMFYTFFTIATFLSPQLFDALCKTLNSFSVYDLHEFYDQGYMSGITAHYTTNGIYLMSGVVPLGLLCFCDKENRIKSKHKPLILVAFLLNVLALLLSGKRAHTIFTLIALIIVIYLFNADRPKGRIVKMLVFVAIGISLVVLLANFIPEVLNVINRFVEAQEETGSILNDRDVLQVDIYAAIADSPLLGKGWAWYPWNNSYNQGTCCHNVYLQLFGELGFVGSIPFYFFFANMMLRGCATLTRARRKIYNIKINEQLLLGMGIGFQIYFLLYCSTGNPLYDFNCFFPYFVWCSIQEAIIFANKKRRREAIDAYE